MGVKIEAEGGELILRNNNGDVAIIPAKHRQEVLDMVKDGCNGCLDDYIRRLPKQSDYAADGTVIDNPWQQALPSPTIAQQYYDKSVTPTPVISNPTVIAPITTQLKPDALNVVNTLAAGDITRFEEEAKHKVQVSNLVEGDDFKVEPIKIRSDMKLPTKKGDIITLQNDMYNKGYYDTAIDVKTYTDKDSIYDLQVMLNKRGYKTPINRVMDETTIHAVAKFNYDFEVDGFVGKRTRAAFDKYKELTIQPVNFNVRDEKSAIVSGDEYILDAGDRIGISHVFNYLSGNPFNVTTDTRTIIPNCTKYVNNKVRATMSADQADQIGIYGDAWTIRMNILNAGGIDIFNVNYTIPNKFDLTAIKTNIKKAITASSLPINDIVPGQYVELYNPNSDKFEIAYSEGAKGGTITTHLGLITADKDNKLYVEHNVHGHIYKEPLEKFANHTAANGVEITRIIQPNYDKTIGTPKKGVGKYYDAENLGIEFKKESSGRGAGSPNAYLFQKTILLNKDIIEKNFGINDNDFKSINKIAYAVAALQTQFGNAPTYKEALNPTAIIYSTVYGKTSIRSGIARGKVGRMIADVLDVVGVRDESKGYGQVKEEDLFGENYVKTTGIDKLKEDSPEYGALTTVSAIAAKYKVLSTLINDANVSIDKPEFESLLMIAHNQGFDNIKQDIINYKQTGNYNYIKQYDRMLYTKFAKQTIENHVRFF